MTFWDTSAVVPLCIDQPMAPTVRSLFEDDPRLTVWWGTVVECWASFARLEREGRISGDGAEEARRTLLRLAEAWEEIEPSEHLRSLAGRLLRVHRLRSGDALQLAAALVAVGGQPRPGDVLVSFDDRLREAARLEGFHVLPR